MKGFGGGLRATRCSGGGAGAGRAPRHRGMGREGVLRRGTGVRGRAFASRRPGGHRDCTSNCREAGSETGPQGPNAKGQDNPAGGQQPPLYHRISGENCCQPSTGGWLTVNCRQLAVKPRRLTAGVNGRRFGASGRQWTQPARGAVCGLRLRIVGPLTRGVVGRLRRIGRRKNGTQTAFFS